MHHRSLTLFYIYFIYYSRIIEGTLYWSFKFSVWITYECKYLKIFIEYYFNENMVVWEQKEILVDTIVISCKDVKLEDIHCTCSRWLAIQAVQALEFLVVTFPLAFWRGIFAYMLLKVLHYAKLQIKSEIDKKWMNSALS